MIERGQSLRIDTNPIAANKKNASRNQTASLTHWSLDKSFILSQKDIPLTEAQIGKPAQLEEVTHMEEVKEAYDPAALFHALQHAKGQEVAGPNYT